MSIHPLVKQEHVGLTIKIEAGYEYTLEGINQEEPDLYITSTNFPDSIGDDCRWTLRLAEEYINKGMSYRK